MERQCKGIWIPIEIWENKSMSWNEKILFLEIDSYTSKNKDCYISNEYIAEFLGVTETSANKILSSLISKGYVVKTKFDGRRRYVKTNFVYCKSALPYEESQPCCLEQGCIAAESNIPIQYTKTDTNTDEVVEKKEWREDFNAYLNLVNQAKCDLLSDSEYKAYIEKYYPNADYEQSISKLVDGFWGKQEGWEYCKKKRKGKTINMLTTLKKNLDARSRIVYKPLQTAKVKSSFNGTQNRVKVKLNPNVHLVDNDGKLSDGTFLKADGLRYYFSYIDKKTYSIPLDAEPMPQSEKIAYDYKNGWYECE